MRVGIYARVSTEAQEARGTIGSQLETLRAKVAAEGDDLVAEFVDDGFSGARLDRPGLDALRDAAEQGAVEAVWCLSPDRLARSFAYQMLVLDELSRLGVVVHFTDSPPIDNDPEARLLVQVQGVIAEYEKAKFAETGTAGQALPGQGWRGAVPKGALWLPARSPRAQGPAHLVVHDQEAAVVRRVFADFVGGASVRGLAVALVGRGHRLAGWQARVALGHDRAPAAQRGLRGTAVLEPHTYELRPLRRAQPPGPPATRGVGPDPRPGHHHRGDLRVRPTSCP